MSYGLSIGGVFSPILDFVRAQSYTTRLLTCTRRFTDDFAIALKKFSVATTVDENWTSSLPLVAEARCRTASIWSNADESPSSRRRSARTTSTLLRQVGTGEAG